MALRRARSVGWRKAGPLPVAGICDIIRDYGIELVGTPVIALPVFGASPPISIGVRCDGSLMVLSQRGELLSVNITTMVCAPATIDQSSSCAMAVLPSGELALSKWEGSVCIVRDKSLFTLAGHTNWADALAVMPDGKLVSGSNDNTVRIWDTTSGACLLTLADHTDGVNALAVLPDGRLVSGSDDLTVRVWE